MNTALKTAIEALTYREMVAFCRRIDLKDPHSVARKLLDYCGELETVDAGPVPDNDRDILDYRNGECGLLAAFNWARSNQGSDYWEAFEDTPYTDLPPVPKAIIDAWCAELEANG